ncbi:MAG: motif family protein [Acidobacteriota bacterium]|jgi:Spy/CpxP family protein refolding chaperone|nr:motif family protein [Acidobacteriota bacterium]
MKVPFKKIVGGGTRTAVAVSSLVLSLLLLVLAPAPQARAQEQDAQPAPQEGGAQPQGGVRGKNLMQQLSLTQEQRGLLREIRKQSEAKARELTRMMRLARRALEEAIYSDNVDETVIEQRARELSAAQAALVRFRAQTELKVRRILTPEQLQSFRDLRLQAQRRQLMKRRLLRGNKRQQQQQQQSPGALDQNPGGATAPAAGTPREPRPANTPRPRGTQSRP